MYINIHKTEPLKGAPVYLTSKPVRADLGEVCVELTWSDRFYLNKEEAYQLLSSLEKALLTLELEEREGFRESA